MPLSGNSLLSITKFVMVFNVVCGNDPLRSQRNWNLYRDSSLSGEGVAGATANLSLVSGVITAEGERSWLADARLPRDLAELPPPDVS